MVVRQTGGLPTATSMTERRQLLRQDFEGIDIRGGCLIADQVLERCTASICHAHAKSHLQRPTFRRILVKNCKLVSTDAHGAVFDDCTIDGLLTNRLSMVTCCAFRHVTVRGNVGQFMIRGAGDVEPDPLDRANAEFYKGVDWALDITAVRATTLDIRNVPLHLIRRDPETQAVVRRAHLAHDDMVRLGLGPTATQLLSTFLPHGPDEKLFVAGVRSKTYDRWVEAFAQLRDAGLAD